MSVILENMPKEAEVTRIEFEGPRLAIYVRNVNLLLEQSHVITDIVNLLHKRIVVRSDASVRMPESDAGDVIRKMIPAEAEITSTNFDPSLGEVIIEAKKPGLVIGKDGLTLQEIIKSTGWRPRILRAPPIPSKIIATMRHMTYTESEERSRILRDVGERIFRPTINRASSVMLTPLGGSREVGRSCILVEANESTVLLDCGINPGSHEPDRAYPRLNIDQFNIEKLDAVIISHAHLDHCGLVPFLYKYGYDGPVYCSEPTAVLMTLLQLDYLDVISREGGYAPFDQKNVREVVMHTIPLKYGVVTDVAPDMKLTLHNAGHILGSSIIHLHIGEGLHNIVYTSDFKFGKTMLLEPATSVFPRVETLITESTYGGQGDIMPNRTVVESKLASTVNETFKRGGKVLIPMPAVGRAQEIMMILDSHMKSGSLMEAPIYVDGMISEATAIHTAYPEYLSREIRDMILHQDINPFKSDYFVNVTHPSEREGIVNGGPSVILATSGMLEGGPALEYLRLMGPDERNTLIFVSYQIDGTLGSRIRNGVREINLIGPTGKIEAVKINMAVESFEGFSGHSDRNQILEFLRRISAKPSKVIVNHGEYKKCENMAATISSIFKVKSIVPDNLETLRLK
ncbi:beta-CASP ribonuclease aCPSF1 [Candidatus Bathyarchaeota archaeon]|nr:beta-CASP ribonuclease aCPSF1 [Candidatus Bathyarchaeota archaeon]MBS7629212.1 beta-CASP ribonuclease aCPSF1 [Candidatus Bathyarchaeota archaeon]